MVNLQSQYQGRNGNVQIWNGSSFESIDSTINNNQLGEPLNSFGPEFSFGKRLSDHLEQRIFMTKFAIGSTVLAEVSPQIDWNPDSVGEHYDTLVGHVDASIVAQNITRIILFWQQGEGDAENEANADLYDTNLPLLVNAFRAQYPSIQVDVILGNIHDDLPPGTFPFDDDVRTAYSNGNGSLSRTALIDPDAYPLEGDSTHYDATGQDDQGEDAFIIERDKTYA